MKTLPTGTICVVIKDVKKFGILNVPINSAVEITRAEINYNNNDNKYIEFTPTKDRLYTSWVIPLRVWPEYLLPMTLTRLEKIIYGISNGD